MYLDPGSTSLFVQALFALFASIFATFGRSRIWIAAAWSWATRGIFKNRRRTNA